MHKYFFYCIAAAIIFSIDIFGGTVFAHDCEKANILYHQAMSTAQGKERLDLLNNSLAAFPTFAGFYESGRTLVAMGRLTRAEKAYNEAKTLAGDDISQAKVYVSLGTVYEKLDRLEDAYTCYKLSKGYHQFPKVVKKIMAMDEVRSKEGVLSKSIVNRLTTVSKAYGVEPAIDLYVHFELNSDQLKEKGLVQVKELGKAMRNPVFLKHHFVIIGHTDSQGDQEDNLRLSKRRAKTVKSWLKKNYGLPDHRITTKGRGEEELLYVQNSEQAHALNRRVEVRLRIEN
ncbi:OmpA family protein [Desulfobacula toluolica]|uniref:AmpA/MotB domain protein n=1 Tax=Desulfobacula toluolica (strain DSM 7467 / Tol2) TaxID=651182 RepID=K0NL52_DESTT|nr:OmpA family protein [Desulfobacula toluolica]CCK80688.1 AmpA/MotB domain protein [Desulfobacula toluolica Tol2]